MPPKQRRHCTVPGKQKASPSRGRRLGVLQTQATESRAPATKVIPALLTEPLVGRYAYSPQQAAEVCNRLPIRAIHRTLLIKGPLKTSQGIDRAAVLPFAGTWMGQQNSLNCINAQVREPHAYPCTSQVITCHCEVSFLLRNNQGCAASCDTDNCTLLCGIGSFIRRSNHPACMHDIVVLGAADVRQFMQSKLSPCQG